MGVITNSVSSPGINLHRITLHPADYYHHQYGDRSDYRLKAQLQQAGIDEVGVGCAARSVLLSDFTEIRKLSGQFMIYNKIQSSRQGYLLFRGGDYGN